MTPLEACVAAIAYNHGLDPSDVLRPGSNLNVTYHRRVAAAVAHTAFKVSAVDIAAGFGRSVDWVFDVLERVNLEARESRLTARDVSDTERRARAILDRNGGSDPAPPKSVGVFSTLTENQLAEAKRLRAKGWAIPGLARRYGVTPEQIAPVIGETWGAQP